MTVKLLARSRIDGYNFRGFFGGTTNRGVEGRDDEQFAALVFRLPIAGQLEWIKAACRTDNERLRAAQKDAEALLLDGGVEATDDHAVRGAPALSEVHRFDNLRARASL